MKKFIHQFMRDFLIISIGFVSGIFWNDTIIKSHIAPSVKAEDLLENPKEVILRCIKCGEDTVFMTENYVCKECRNK